jgi:hypothetical protein
MHSSAVSAIVPNWGLEPLREKLLDWNIKIIGNGMCDRRARFADQHVLDAAIWQAAFSFKGGDAAVALSNGGLDVFWMWGIAHE